MIDATGDGAQAASAMPPRSLLAQFRRPGGLARAWLSAVLALSIALKLLVPQGWMPSPDGGLMLCPDQVPTAPAPMMAHGGMHHGAQAAHASPAGDEQPNHAMPKGERCAFAGLGLVAAPVPATPALATPIPLPRAAPVARFAVTVGRGLAAPPPPSTGPPASA